MRITIIYIFVVYVPVKLYTYTQTYKKCECTHHHYNHPLQIICGDLIILRHVGPTTQHQICEKKNQTLTLDKSKRLRETAHKHNYQGLWGQAGRRTDLANLAQRGPLEGEEGGRAPKTRPLPQAACAAPENTVTTGSGLKTWVRIQRMGCGLGPSVPTLSPPLQNQPRTAEPRHPTSSVLVT